MNQTLLQLIVFLPLLGALIAGLLGRSIGHRSSEIVTSSLLVLSALFSWIVFLQWTMGGGDAGHGAEAGHGGEHAFVAAESVKVELFRWISTAGLDLHWMIRVDTLTAVMLVVVTTVSSLVHIYSIGYMHEDPHRSRFFAYLSLFTFAMLMLVTANNFLQMFFGWEGVGVASYLLIGFWYKKPSANAAAMKAFIVNRVGDFGFALGIFAAFLMLGSLDFDTAFSHVAGMEGKTISFLWANWDAMTVICLLLFLGAMGKSAQFLLHTWLPDAMEGPTPVSALIHAATMVTAGVFMVARLSPMFEASETAMTVVVYVGAITAFFAATVGLVQNDIKRVIAYSTCSQLGYMFVALGLGAYSAGIFHLFTHAFFKALLFLGAGSVIHAMHHEQDMRKMGGIKDKVPLTYWMMMIGTLALTGVGLPLNLLFDALPNLGFAGFYSKDSIIEAAYGAHTAAGGFAFWALVVAALFTSFYSWRLVHLTFHGETRASKETFDHAHESPMVMLVPLFVLAAGAVFAGYIWYDSFFGHAEHVEHFFKGAVVVDAQLIDDAHHVPVWVKLSATFAMIIGFLAAWYFYIVKPDVPKTLAKEHSGLYAFLLNKWYFDELYDFLFVRPAKWIGTALWRGFDDWLIDGMIVGGIAQRVRDITTQVVRLQSGYLYHYALAMLIGVAALITWAIAAGGLLG
ncbi:NADH-quinone oxidoreductase subunit L [Maritalea porphyrae]|uniref:NADH-quinone oxidoreductase subunit L n=1 Tax=Maritalea porphyrae TaxID=880732 RepID=UPI0022AEAA61|nr:NADH-quinone oxidoreductase subunit L [Maritalea porphyrae]MCZ4273019.1 NADH-quinone oxidoreductase subunit L [Maritalea porphyrae]